MFWSQPGYKYRPPPRLDRSEQESQKAFKEHFDKELALYDKVYNISLVEQMGKEKVSRNVPQLCTVNIYPKFNVSCSRCDVELRNAFQKSVNSEIEKREQ